MNLISITKRRLSLEFNPNNENFCTGVTFITATNIAPVYYYIILIHLGYKDIYIYIYIYMYYAIYKQIN